MKSDYVDIAGVPTFYEVDGEGAPLLLLHGGLCSNEVCSAIAAKFAERFTVYAFERRGHGRTADAGAPFTYEAMADESVAFMDAVGLDAAHVVGFSDGGDIGLLLAAHQPARVRRLVSISGNYKSEGSEPPAGQPERGDMGPLLAVLAEGYGRLSPDGPEHLAEVMPRMMGMWRGWAGLTLDELGSINAPTLVLAADADAIALEHTVEMYRALPNAQLAIVPNASHNLVNEHVDLVSDLVVSFLAD